jgi:hypothetical protein
MSQINANIVVQPFDINITLDQPGITVTPNVTSLNIYAVGGTNGVPAGNVGDLQYYAANGFAAIPSNVANYTSNNLNLNIGNLKISGGNNGYFLQTDGAGNIDWAVGGGGGGNGTPGGSNTQIQYNDAGSFGGSTGFTFNKTSNLVSMPGALVVTGNISGTNANLSGNITAVTVTANLNGSATTAGTVTGNAQSNITSVGTLNTLAVNGSITAVDITANTGIFTGNAAGLTNIPGANVTGQVGNALIAGTVYTNAQPNITSVGTLTNLSVTGNITAANIIGNITGSLANGTSSVSIPTANGNIILDVDGTDRLIMTNAGANFVGNLSFFSAPGISAGNIEGLTFANASQFVGANANVQKINITTGNSLAIGFNSSATGSANSTVIGTGAKISGFGSTAIGFDANAGGQGTSIGWNAGLLLGSGANLNTCTFIGANTGYRGLANANPSAITSIGFRAGYQVFGTDTVAIGSQAGRGTDGSLVTTRGQGNRAIAIGAASGMEYQGTDSITIGAFSSANNQGIGSIVIGTGAGNNAANNSITIDATGANLSANIANALFVKPIRNASNANIVMYNQTSGEVTYNTLTNYTGYVSTISTTVNALVAANSVNSGTRAYVTDGNTTTFYSVIGSGGSNGVPVFSDGTDWRVG